MNWWYWGFIILGWTISSFALGILLGKVFKYCGRQDGEEYEYQAQDNRKIT